MIIIRDSSDPKIDFKTMLNSNFVAFRNKDGDYNIVKNRYDMVGEVSHLDFYEHLNKAIRAEEEKESYKICKNCGRKIYKCRLGHWIHTDSRMQSCNNNIATP
jgi:RNA polymerase-binding transcription factor DksA